MPSSPEADPPPDDRSARPRESAWGPLRNPDFRRLYLAQFVHLAGDALVWVALALLAFEIAGARAAAVLGIALTLRVGAYVVLAPFAGVLADRLPRAAIMITALVGRAVILVALAGATAEWQLYLAMFAMNALAAFFTPTYQASVPAVTTRAEYPRAIALSGATFELLGVLGPGVAGAVALAYGGRLLFVVAAVALAVSVVLLIGLRARLDASVAAARHGGAEPTDGASDAAPERGWAELVSGTRWLWRDPLMRFGLALELVASIGWAWILVNSVVLVRASLGLDEFAYGVVMAAFGLGATLFALWLASRGSSLRPRFTMTVGAIAITVAVLPADMMGIAPLAALWFLAGAGSNAVNLPMFTLMAERTPHARHGRVYGAHFAWSHLWWLAAYPLAGWLGSAMPNASYAVGGGVAAVVLVIVLVTLAPAAGRVEVASTDTLEHGT